MAPHLFPAHVAGRAAAFSSSFLTLQVPVCRTGKFSAAAPCERIPLSSHAATPLVSYNEKPAAAVIQRILPPLSLWWFPVLLLYVILFSTFLNLPPPCPPLSPLSLGPQVHRRLGGAFDARVHACAASVCELLAGPEGLASPNPEDRQAACGAMGAAMCCAPTAIYGHVMVRPWTGGVRRLLGL